MTSIARTDIADGKKTYQSNEVDGQGSNLAVMPPYVLGSKTRREADPWWEVDLGMSYHLNSVSITIKGAVQQSLEVNLILFDGPVGFENPFLDSMQDAAVAMHTVVLPAHPRPQMEEIEWEMPANLVGGALRVQLRGFHTLHLFRVQAFQGDTMHADNLQSASHVGKDGDETIDFLKSQLSLEIGEEGFDTLLAAEDKRRFNSYASYHPDTFKNTQVYKDRKNRSFAKNSMVSKEEGGGAAKGKQATKQGRLDASVAKLTSKYRGRDVHVNEWIDRAKEASRYFTTEELVVARDMIFNSAMASAADDEKKKKAEEILNNKSTAMLKRAQSSQYGSSRNNQQGVRAQDMYGSALMDLYPRIPLEAVTKALRGCASQVQGRDQRGEIGLMQKSPRFLFLSLADTYIIDRFELVARAWRDTTNRISRLSTPANKSNINANDMNNVMMSTNRSNYMDVQFQQEVSWSQFVIVLYCLSIGTPDHIPPLTFNCFDLKVQEDDDDAKKKKKRQQQKQQQDLDALTQQEDEAEDDFFLTTGEMSPVAKGNTGLGSLMNKTNPGGTAGGVGGVDDILDVSFKMQSRPMTPAFESPVKSRSKLAKALIAPNTSQHLDATARPRTTMLSTAPGALEGRHTRSVDSTFDMTSSRERNKREPKSLKEKTKDEHIERLNLNFGHAQYKLGRIETRVGVDIAPRRLRTKLTEVNLGELPGGLDSLRLGLSYPEELFEIGAGLSATGQPPAYSQSYVSNQSQELSPIAKQTPKLSMAQAEVIQHSGSMESRFAKSLSLDMDELSLGEMDDIVEDELSQCSLNHQLRLHRTTVQKPKSLMTQDSFVLKTNLKPRNRTTSNEMSPNANTNSRTNQLIKRKSQGSFKTLPPATSPLPVKRAPSYKTQQSSFSTTDGEFSDEDTASKPSFSKKHKVLAFKKSCALCLIKFPLTSMPKALLKHVVDLRRLWNPKLVTKFEGRLAEGMSLYNLVPVCTMCNQYFDPDFDSGISPPNQCSASETDLEPDAAAAANTSGGTGAGTGTSILKPRKEPIAFYDRRHAGIKEAGYILRDDDTVVLRSRAKRANEISAECKKDTFYQSKP